MLASRYGHLTLAHIHDWFPAAGNRLGAESMDLDQAIRELYEEKRLLDQVIASLELLLEKEQREVSQNSSSPRRRGRKAMSLEERQTVSRRMKEYWARKRDSEHTDGSGNGENSG